MINEFLPLFKLKLCIVSHLQALLSFLPNQVASNIVVFVPLASFFREEGPRSLLFSEEGRLSLKRVIVWREKKRGEEETSPRCEKEWNGSHSVYSREKERQDSSLFVILKLDEWRTSSVSLSIEHGKRGYKLDFPSLFIILFPIRDLFSLWDIISPTYCYPLSIPYYEPPPLPLSTHNLIQSLIILLYSVKAVVPFPLSSSALFLCSSKYWQMKVLKPISRSLDSPLLSPLLHLSHSLVLLILEPVGVNGKKSQWCSLFKDVTLSF